MNVYRDLRNTLDCIFKDAPYVTLTDMARRSGIGYKRLRKALRDDNVPYLAIGGHKFYERNVIRRWMAQKTVV